MFSTEIRRHFNEFMRDIRNFNYEKSPMGLFMPKSRLYIGGQYSYSHNKGAWSPWEHNLVPTEGINFILNLLGQEAAEANAYITLYSNAYTPIAANTATSFVATYAEITSGSEGYTEATRVLWNPAAASAGAIHNNASPSEFTIATATSLSVNGAAMLTASAKGAGTGVLVSASRFGATRVFSDTDLFDVKYQIGGTST